MSSKRFPLKALVAAAAVAANLGVVGQAQAAVTIIINNINAAGIGFNDSTPAVPVGGNTGTTLGQQRLIAFAHAANIWGAALTSNIPVVINAQFTSLSCTADRGVLGSAGATQIFANWVTGTVPKPSTWYSYALANKMAQVYQGTLNAPQINSNFNVNLGTPGCLETSSWYYGLDGNEPTNGIDFVAVLQHEMAHGLGFQTFTSGSTGAFNGGLPSIWDHFLFSVAAGGFWKDVTAADRVASAISVSGLVWNGPIVTAAAPLVLLQGAANVAIGGVQAGAAAGNYAAGEASFGPLASFASPVVGDLMPVVSNTTAASLTGPGCGPLTTLDALAVNGNIALIDRGVCNLAVKVKNAQNAGARGVIIADNVPGGVAGLGGSDPTVTIPALRITLADATTIRAQLFKRSRTKSGVVASISRIGTQLAGADGLGRVRMFAPNPFQSGSSVSHFDSSATPNLLMEPAINGNLTQAVAPPLDLTLPLFTEIGW